MRNKRKIQSEEINMTPLLDVLFSILFIVMLSGARVQSKNDTAVENLNNQVEALQNQVAMYEHSEKTKDQFYDDVYLITIDNVKETGGRKLRFSCNKPDIKSGEVSLKVDDTDRMKKNLIDYMDPIIKDNKSSPMYIVFCIDESIIYKAEYDAIDMVLTEYESNKEYKIFYKRIIGGKTNEE